MTLPAVPPPVIPVSILVFLELAPGRDEKTRPTNGNAVSILVFLELAPGPPSHVSYVTLLHRFNPCFSGTRARTPRACKVPGVHPVFQSLFFWNSRPDVTISMHHRLLGTFQSLFFWNSRPDIRSRSLRLGSGTVSILVFLELAPGHESAKRYVTTHRVSILVFLELAPGPGSPQDAPGNLPGFNPCFSGTRARTPIPFLSHEPQLSFNPCFSGTRARTGPPTADPRQFL